MVELLKIPSQFGVYQTSWFAYQPLRGLCGRAPLPEGATIISNLIEKRPRKAACCRGRRVFVIARVWRNLVSSRFGDDCGDHTCCSGGQDEVAIYLAPFIAAGRFVQMIVTVIDSFAAVPIFVAHVSALLPLFVANVMMVVMVIFSKSDGDCEGGSKYLIG